ncbi:hypothetical protein C481_16065 [Natrialba asiatica DSM 12278]|uniref:Uncharacterized protein n=1 Tax=Natrialba asiatica (strain ATCC 700177 / DSM 12278 / JCM 9576 / FERM P-10747 / NBRC 102637 / 172P1) TaxID=29540 RepID=M0AN71_NATA1|nr:hypothetical protein C481_16065 [Natrialba asiatica DSM 12278]
MNLLCRSSLSPLRQSNARTGSPTEQRDHGSLFAAIDDGRSIAAACLRDADNAVASALASPSKVACGECTLGLGTPDGAVAVKSDGTESRRLHQNA